MTEMPDTPDTLAFLDIFAAICDDQDAAEIASATHDTPGLQPDVSKSMTESKDRD